MIDLLSVAYEREGSSAHSISELTGWACLNNIAIVCGNGRIEKFIPYGFTGGK